MATHTGSAITSPMALATGWRRARTWQGAALPLAAVVTFYYRTANGSTRGSTTSLASVPPSSVIERITR